MQVSNYEDKNILDEFWGLIKMEKQEKKSGLKKKKKECTLWSEAQTFIQSVLDPTRRAQTEVIKG